MKVSIITTSFNSQKTILDTINSVNNQTYSNIEHIFVDGKSSDKTVEIIKNNSKRKKTLISEKDFGIYDAMNKGIINSSGDIIAILNSDDIYCDENSIKKVVDFFKKNKCEIAYSNMYIMCADLKKILRNVKSKNYSAGLFKRGWHPPHTSLFIKKTIYDEYGLFNTKYKIASDFDLMFRFIHLNKLKPKFIDNYLVMQRHGGESTKSFKNRLKGNFEILRSVIKSLSLTDLILFFPRRFIIKFKQNI